MRPTTPKTLACRIRALVGVGCVLSFVGAAACGSEPVKRRQQRGAGPPGGAMAANLNDVGKPSADVVADKSAKGPKKKRRKRKRLDFDLPDVGEFTERDFTENNQESRDPFRNLLVKEPTKAQPKLLDPGDIVYLKDYPLAELRVTGIVGGWKRYAMVLDPRTGRTTIINKRDRMAKERALVYEINRDHLVLLVPRIRPNKADPYERLTKYVDETRKIVDISTDPIRPDQTGIRISGGRRIRRAPPKEQ